MRGEWIEICDQPPVLTRLPRLSACAESGLKFSPVHNSGRLSLSLCLRGEWIEIESGSTVDTPRNGLSACAESGLKSNGEEIWDLVQLSLCLRGEWIEMVAIIGDWINVFVSLLARRVD